MRIIDLDAEHESLFVHCLEEWSEEMKASGPHRACWVEKMKAQGLGAKLALDDAGVAGGMIQYIPIEHAPAEGEGLYFIPCIWVHGHKQGRGNFQKRGMGKALLQAAEENAKSRGALGMVAWGLALPFWMKASWYRRQGYRKVDSMQMQVLLFKPFSPEAKPPRWIRPKKKPELVPGKVTVTALVGGSCSVGGINYERAKLAAQALGDRVVFHGVDTSERATFLEWGLTDAVFINHKRIGYGPPLSVDAVVKQIRKRLRRLRVQ